MTASGPYRTWKILLIFLTIQPQVGGRTYNPIATCGETLKFARAVVLIFAGSALLWGFIMAMNSLDRLRDPNRLAFILNIQSVPSSVRDVNCSSDAITDVIISCAFAINPKDFEHLLTGWHFDKRSSGKSTSYLDYPNLGREFDVGVWYRIQPASFEHGGVVELLGNTERTLAVASRYEE